jgi:hypothetical protein
MSRRGEICRTYHEPIIPPTHPPTLLFVSSAFSAGTLAVTVNAFHPKASSSDPVTVYAYAFASTSKPPSDGEVIRSGSSATTPNTAFADGNTVVSVSSIAGLSGTASYKVKIVATGPQEIESVSRITLSPNATASLTDFSITMASGSLTTLTSAISSSLTSNVTVAVWVKPDAVDDFFALLNLDGSGINYQKRQAFFQGNDALQWHIYSNIVNFGLGWLATRGAWRQYVLTYGAGRNDVAVYLDGVLVGSTSGGSAHITPNNVTVGFLDGFVGEVFELVVFGSHFDLADCQELYNGGVPLDPASHSKAGTILSNYRFRTSQISGDTVMDLSGNGHTIDVTGGLTLNQNDMPYLS